MPVVVTNEYLEGATDSKRGEKCGRKTNGSEIVLDCQSAFSSVVAVMDPPVFQTSGVQKKVTGSSPGARNNKQQLCWWCLVPLIRDTGTSLWGGAEGRSWLEALCPRCSAGLQPFPEVCWWRGDTGVGVTPRGYLCKLILWQLARD